ncbi:hypothetical protein BUALT_Bualt12G0074200 [Buddleja alternifolia]|uniref:BZIP domain-containing protein n=1 Tax=Buddleja alternifolia TaxID=168488 RepID=A0AAV6WU78_9LAMI|nr:hypothetical protein BUALT_Bualt12G0074200 [Buddleja alternifolia]
MYNCEMDVKANYVKEINAFLEAQASFSREKVAPGSFEGASEDKEQKTLGGSSNVTHSFSIIDTVDYLDFDGFLYFPKRNDSSQRRCALEDWMGKILSDMDFSRSAPVACFLELEAAARSSEDEQTSHYYARKNRRIKNRYGRSYGKVDHELAVRDYLTTKVKDLETELKSTKTSGKENLEQAVLIERERFTQMQWDMEELTRNDAICLDICTSENIGLLLVLLMTNPFSYLAEYKLSSEAYK